MKKIIVYIATSADGYIARPDGDVEWLNRPRTAGDYGMRAFYRSIDTILWGRKTYEVALGFQKQGVQVAEFDTNVRNYVFSRRPPKDAAPGVEFVTEAIPAFAERLRDHFIRDALPDASKAAGIPYGQRVEGAWTVHDLRRTYLTLRSQHTIIKAHGRPHLRKSCPLFDHFAGKTGKSGKRGKH
jgi:hypothetical protein